MTQKVETINALYPGFEAEKEFFGLGEAGGVQIKFSDKRSFPRRVLDDVDDIVRALSDENVSAHEAVPTEKTARQIFRLYEAIRAENPVTGDEADLKDLRLLHALSGLLKHTKRPDKMPLETVYDALLLGKSETRSMLPLPAVLKRTREAVFFLTNDQVLPRQMDLFKCQFLFFATALIDFKDARERRMLAQNKMNGGR